MSTQNNLRLVLNSELERRRISAREAARQSGLSHTTIVRALRGDNVDLETIRLVCTWLEIDPTKVVDFGHDQSDDVWMGKFTALITSNPLLKENMCNVFRKIEIETVNPKIIDEICAYIMFSLEKNQYGN
jgi:DNA-binding Xre family transcriptional regulator